MVNELSHRGGAEADHTAVAAVGVVIPCSIASANHPQPKLSAPPEHDRQDQAIEPSPGDDRGEFEIKAASFGIGGGGLDPGAVAIGAHPCTTLGACR